MMRRAMLVGAMLVGAVTAYTAGGSPRIPSSSRHSGVARSATAQMAVPLTGNTLQAALKMKCDTSGAGYAIYWCKVGNELVVAGDYLTDARREVLKKRGMEGSFPQLSEAFTLAIDDPGPVATCYREGKQTFVKDASNSNMKRAELAAKFGITAVCFAPQEDGVLEFGTTNSDETATWNEMPQGLPVMDNAALRDAYEKWGATYSMFWAKRPDRSAPSGESYQVIADHMTEDYKAALEKARGDQETFCSGSRVYKLDPASDGPVVTVARTGETLVIEDMYAAKSPRADLAAEFGIKSVHLVPTEGGVLEFGVPMNTYLEGNMLAAMLKMRTEVNGAGYARYWRRTIDGEQLTFGGEYISPAQQMTLIRKGQKPDVGKVLERVILDLESSESPQATAVRNAEPIFIPDVGSRVYGTLSPELREAAITLGVQSLCIEPVEGGVLEYATSHLEYSPGRPCTVQWDGMNEAQVAILPKGEMKKAFAEGATHVTFWQRVGDNYMARAYYLIPERIRALRQIRDDDKSFPSESQDVLIDANSEDPVAVAANSNKEIVLKNPAETKSFKRRALSEEFQISNLHFVPCTEGVLEYGVGTTT